MAVDDALQSGRSREVAGICLGDGSFELRRRDNGRDVEERALDRRDGNAFDAGFFVTGEVHAMHAQAVNATSVIDPERDVDERVGFHPQQAPQHGGTDVADDGVLAAREDRRPFPRARVVDGTGLIHAPKDAGQSPGFHQTIDVWGTVPVPEAGSA